MPKATVTIYSKSNDTPANNIIAKESWYTKSVRIYLSIHLLEQAQLEFLILTVYQECKFLSLEIVNFANTKGIPVKTSVNSIEMNP